MNEKIFEIKKEISSIEEEITNNFQLIKNIEKENFGFKQKIRLLEEECNHIIKGAYKEIFALCFDNDKQLSRQDDFFSSREKAEKYAEYFKESRRRVKLNTPSIIIIGISPKDLSLIQLRLVDEKLRFIDDLYCLKCGKWFPDDKCNICEGYCCKECQTNCISCKNEYCCNCERTYCYHIEICLDCYKLSKKDDIIKLCEECDQK